MDEMIGALLITIAVESAVLFLFLRKKRPASGILFAGIVVNMVTNPALNLLQPYFNLVLLECCVILVESALYSMLLDLGIKEGFLISVCANVASASPYFLMKADVWK